ncbi:MAG: hypothetical protein FD174_113 [Geobacteraceae bacterium]|nr:MAG: hypothetical protein FD174_113 [Geobacteraceae bacterium]
MNQLFLAPKQFVLPYALLTSLLLLLAMPPAVQAATVAVGTWPQAIAVNPATNKFYVANYGFGNNVTVIDGATNATITVAAGTEPRAVAVNPVTNRIYVANYGSHNVTVVDGATNSTTTIATGASPVSIAVNPVTNRIYVVNSGSYDVTVIDGATNATSTVAAGTAPSAVAVNPVTNKIYVANFSNDLTVIDGASNTTSNVAIGASQRLLAVNPITNKIYVTNQSNNVTVIDGASNATSTVAAGAGSFAVAVNPVTNRVYVSNQTSNDVTIIDGATNTTSTVAVGTSPRGLAVNPTTNTIYVTNGGSANVTVIDGATNATSTVAAGTIPIAVAVNPVTNKIHVANYGSNTVTVLDGAANTTSTVAAGTLPYAVAVNPVTNKIYVTNYNSNNVTVIDGATNATSTVAAGTNPRAVAVNPATNKIYVANFSSANVTVIDGATNATSTVAAGTKPYAVAVNPVTDKIYVANFGSNNITLIDGATNATSTVAAGTSPFAVAVNPVTNKIYVANEGSNNVTVIDGVTNATSTVAAGGGAAVAVNPVTNRIYVAKYGTGECTVIDGATNATSTVVVGINPQAITVNPVTNKIYVANYGSANVTVIDGASNATTTVAVGTNPTVIAVNPATNRIYVATSGIVTFIDGVTNATSHMFADTNNPRDVAVNPVTNRVYITNQTSNDVTVIDEQAAQPIPLSVVIAPLSNNVSSSPTPTFSLTAASTFTPPTILQNVYYQYDTWQGEWKSATTFNGTSGTVNDATPLLKGGHVLYMFATDGQEATSTNTGYQGSPLIGSIAAYAFTVTGPIPTPPSATSGAATSITQTGATLNGTVNDNGADTTITFEYGLTTAHGSSASGGTVASGAGSTAVSAAISGLACGTTYHFRVNAVNSGGTTNGSDQTFTTAACTYTISAAVIGGNGSISCTSPVNQGNSSTCTITPAGEYHLATFTDDTVDKLASVSSGSYTISSVTANHAIVGTFAPDPGTANSGLPAGPGDIITVAGGGVGDGVTATSASLYYPRDVTVDGAGNYYIADYDNNRIRKVDGATGVITTVAGNGNYAYSGDNGPAIAAALARPTGVAVDGAGNLYIADSGNHRIRRVDAATGIITTVAGTGAQGYSGDGGAATAAALNRPIGVVVDGAGNVYLADTNNSRIRKIDGATGIITTVAGNGTFGYSGDGGAATAATLRLSDFVNTDRSGIALDGAGNLHIADTFNHRIRKVDLATGIITTVAGNGIYDNTGDGGTATSAAISYPSDIAFDGAGNLYLVGYHRIRKVDAATGIISTFAGNGQFSYSGDGGAATAAALGNPYGIAADGAGNLYIADTSNHRIRRVDGATGVISTIAGTGQYQFGGDGVAATEARLGINLRAVAFDGAGNYYITDSDNNRIRKVDGVTGVIGTVAGNGVAGYSGDNGPATAAALYSPRGVAFDSAENLYIPDTANNRIRKVDVATGIISTVAGNGVFGYSGDGGAATSAAIKQPAGIAFDGAGNLYIVDNYNQRIRKVDGATGTISTVAGNGVAGYAGDGGAAIAAAVQLDHTSGIAFDGTGNLYIADTTNNRIRKVDGTTGIITTVAGDGSYNYYGDGNLATSAALKYPAGVAFDGAGNLYIGDAGNQRIRKVTSTTGVITTVAGNGGNGYSGDGGPATAAKLSWPYGVTVYGNGNIYIADSTNGRIRKVLGGPNPPTTTTGSAASITQTGATLNGTVNDNGGDTAVTFEFGLTTAYGSSASGGTVAAGAGSTAVSAAVTGLACGASYHFRVNGASSGGTANGSDQTFSTAACPETTPPTVTGAIPTGPTVRLNSNVTITWNENIDCTTVNTTNITISGGGWTLSGCSGNQAVFTTSGQSSSTPYTVTVLTAVKDLAGNAMAADYTWTFTTGSTQVYGHILDDNTVALWRLNEASASSNAVNETGVYHLTQFGNPDAIPGKIDNGRLLGGTSKYFQSPGDASLGAALNGDWTYEGWVYLDPSFNTGANLFIYNGLAFSFNQPDTILAEVGILADRKIYWHQWQSTSSYTEIASNATLQTGQYYHLAVSRTAQGGNLYTYRIYVNGILDKTTTGVAGLSYPVSGASHYIGLGNFTSIVGFGIGGNVLNGSLDDTRISKVARTDAEILESSQRVAPAYTVNFVVSPLGTGTLTGTTSQSGIASGGSTTAVTPAPNAGYSFVNWTGTGGFATSTSNPLTVTNVTANMTVTANFADSQVPTDGTLTATPGNGQVSLSWTAAADNVGVTGYKLVISTTATPADCTGTAIYSGTGLSFTDTGLTNGTTYFYRVCATDNTGNTSGGVTASAAPLPSQVEMPLQYNITASADSDGTISQPGAVSVNTGASQTFTFTPRFGYHIKDVIVDGASVGAISSYTFTNVTANHAIEVSFAAPDGRLASSGGTAGSVSVVDAMVALRIAIGGLPPTPEHFVHGDVAPLINGKPVPDGKIDLGDAIVLLRRVVGLVNW